MKEKPGLRFVACCMTDFSSGFFSRTHRAMSMFFNKLEIESLKRVLMAMKSQVTYCVEGEDDVTQVV